MPYPPNPRGVILAVQDLQSALTAAFAGGTLAAHLAAPDPHGQYALESALGTMAAQSAASVAITGGTLDNVAITNLPAPSNGGDPATKAYADAIAQGLDLKQSARLAATGNVNVSNPGTSTFDGIPANNGDRIFLFNQSAGSQNGLYTFNGSGSAMTRTADADTSAKVTPGMWVIVEEGTAYQDTGWILTTNTPITLGTTPLSFVQFPSNALAPTRTAGFITPYNGAANTGSGFIFDYDGYWVYLTLDAIRTIGNLSSGAHIAQAWTFPLFSHLWVNFASLVVTDSSGSPVARGVDALTDYNANRRIFLPDYRGRDIIGAGTGGSLTARTKGTTGGAETHALTGAETGPHSHGLNPLALAGTPAVPIIAPAGAGNFWNNPFTGGNQAQTIISTEVSGLGNAHNNMQPWAAEHFLISAGSR